MKRGWWAREQWDRGMRHGSLLRRNKAVKNDPRSRRMWTDDVKSSVVVNGKKRVWQYRDFYRPSETVESR